MIVDKLACTGFQICYDFVLASAYQEPDTDAPVRLGDGSSSAPHLLQTEEHLWSNPPSWRLESVSGLASSSVIFWVETAGHYVRACMCDVEDRIDLPISSAHRSSASLFRVAAG